MSEWITTEDIPGEAWRRVLEFANIDFATAAISAMHDSPTSKSNKANYKKQAEQIRVSILQSKEYFEAAKAATIFTSPNHLYYGMISLASAIMLLRGTGDDSLDRLRQDKKNSAHGLNFTTDASKKSVSEKMRLLSDSYIEVTPAGFFLNWYKTLPSICKICAVATEKRNNVAVRGRREKGSEKVISTDKIVGSKASILGLFGRLPDMSHSLIRYGHIVSISKASFETESVISEMDSKTETFIWRIHGAPNPEALEAILRKFRSRYGLNHLWQLTDFEGQLGCVITFTFPDRSKSDCGGTGIEYPSMREDLNNDLIVYADDLTTHEIVDAYRATYGLSMLSRYYPDLWIRCIDSHCMAAQIIEQFIFVMGRKFPVMALRYLTDKDIVISNHKPSW